ncbi:MAG: hypothetical protein CVV13_12455 [Gammaproteobacteria bacterium HGW-Gammaproteobacteria-3]|nr:MAG: hypothetical protein CVV13_12455 [Gammaproteobacteria bacterium HGW-Gammaproteobacteria-3]
MDIKLPIDAKSQLALAQIKNNPPTLKAGQIIEAKVLQTQAGINALTLELGSKTLRLQSDRPITLNPGAPLKLEVLQVTPSPVFKIINATQDGANLTVLKPPQAENSLLKTQTPPDENTLAKNSASFDKSAPLPPPRTASGTREALVVTAKVVAVVQNQVQLQLSSAATGQKPAASIQITLNRATTAQLQPGQTVHLEMSQSGATPTFKLAETPIKITDLVKQYLPIHESPVQFVKQLMATLPTLQRSESVPVALKRLAAQIMQNLPRQQQLTQGASLKQAISQSGVFLETNLAASLKLPDSEATSQPSQSPLPAQQSQLPPTSDFKAQLLKLIAALKHETGSQNEATVTPNEQNQLKALLQKTESSVATIILDQLTSLPDDQTTQQLWSLEIPFLDKGKAQSVRIEIEKDAQKNEAQDKSGWSVTITVTPPGLGTVHCKVSCQDGVINSHFWSQKTEITDLIKQNLDTFRQQLENSGLEIGHLGAIEGEPTQVKYAGFSGTKLFDENA